MREQPPAEASQRVGITCTHLEKNVAISYGVNLMNVTSVDLRLHRFPIHNCSLLFVLDQYIGEITLYIEVILSLRLSTIMLFCSK